MAAQIDNFELSSATSGVVFSARELTVLNEIATVVSSATDITDVYSSFAALVADVIDWDGIIITLPCGDGQNFRTQVHEGPLVAGRGEGEKYAIEGSLYGEVLKSRKSQIISATEGQTAEWALKIPGIRGALLAGYRSWLATPLISQGNILGVIYVQSMSTDAFTKHDQAIFERIATFVAPTIERFNAYEHLIRDGLHTKSLLRIGRMLLGARDLSDVFDAFVEELKTVVDVDRLAISVAEFDQSAVVDRFIYGVPVEGYVLNNRIPMDAMEPNGLDVNSHGYMITEEKMRAADPITSPGLHANYQAGLRSAMFAGLRLEGMLVGTINVKSVVGDAYAAADLEYFEQVADHLGASIRRSQSYESEIQMNRAAQERDKAQQEALQAVEVIKAKERLLSSASHELRTPLTGILAFVDLLSRNRSGNLEDKQLRYLSIVRRNAEDLSGKVNSLIEHAARDAGQLRMKLENFALTPMLNEVITDANPKLAEVGQSASMDVASEIDIVADRRHLFVAVAHLVENAMNYAPHDSIIRITAVVVGGNVEISVIDQGSGISDEHIGDIFDPFERGKLTGMAENPGAGLGLTYVRAVAEGHGGEARYETSADGGAVFIISIPTRIDAGT